jgi:hypothetical protein
MTTRLENTVVGTEQKVGGQIRARKILSLCRKKLRTIDDEEESFRSVLITNTIKVVRKEISTKGKKKGKKRTRDQIFKRLQIRMKMLGSQRNWKVMKYKMRRIVRGQHARRPTQKK